MLTDISPSTETPPDFIQQLLQSPELAKRLKLAKTAEPAPINPFISRLELDARKKRQGTTEVSVVTDAETGARIGFQQEDICYVDNARFVKIMDKMLGAAFDLDAAGQRIFWLVVDCLKQSPGKDEIYISWAQELKVGDRKVSVSESSFYRGIKALKEAEFITPSERGKGWFWINPSYFFNGDRVRFVNTFIRANPELPELQRPRVKYPEDKKPKETKRAQVGNPQA